MRPRPFELRLRHGRLLRTALGPQGLRQAIQRPAVPGMATEVVAVDDLGLVGAPGLEQHGPERVPDRVAPGWRLVVVQAVLRGDREPQQPDAGVGLALPGRDLA